MEYILSGNPTDVEKVVRENRIRVARGVIKFTPHEPADNENAANVIADLEARNATVQETLNSNADYIAQLNDMVVERDKEIEELRRKIADMEKAEPADAPAADTKDIEPTDSKDAPAADTKEASNADTKQTDVPEEDKKTPKAKAKK